jgi:hypothetical protein
MNRIILTDKKNVRQQHVISDMYLRKFGEDGELFVYEKQRPIRRVVVKKGKQIKEGRERDYFEYEVGGQKSNNAIENWLAEIETRAGDVYPAILSGELLTDDVATNWAVYVASLFLRTRKVRNELAALGMLKVREIMIGEQSIRDAQHDLLKRGHLISYKRLSTTMTRIWDEMQSDPAYGHVLTIQKSTATLAKSILEKRWQTVEASEACSFLSSDSPVITMKIVGGGQVFLGHGFSQPDVAVLLSISPNKLFIASPQTVGWDTVQDENNVTLFNRAIVRFADRAVYTNVNSSRIQKIVDEEIGQIKFGQNAFNMTSSMF